jgi:hypothetical protein
MLVQTIVRSRPTQHLLQIASVHAPDVVLGPCGYPIIDDGWESAVGLVSESAAELIINIIIIIIMGTIIIIVAIVIIIIIVAITGIIITIIVTITIIITTVFAIVFAIVVVAMVVAAMPLPPCAHVWRM